MLIAPTEPMGLKAIGKVSSAPEKFGVDAMFPSPLGTCGIQRKEVADFFASVADGRLAREYPLMNQLAVAVLIIEGQKRWSTEGYLLSGNDYQRRHWTRTQYRSYMMSVQMRGVWVVETDSLQDTVTWIEQFKKWASKGQHNSLITRPKPAGNWGKPESHDWQVFLAQSFPGIGPVQAERLIEHFGGMLPISWTCTKTELGKAPGIGKTRLEGLWAALPEMEEISSD